MISPHQEILDEVKERRDSQSVGLLRVFALYRLVAAVLLLVLIQQGDSTSRLGQLDPDLFKVAIQAYTAINLLILAAVHFLPSRLLTKNSVSVGIVAIDTFAIAGLSYLSGGISSGLAPLLLVSVAAGACLLYTSPSPRDRG